MKKIFVVFFYILLASNLALAQEYKDDSFESKNKIYGRTKISVGFERQKFNDKMYKKLLEIAGEGKNSVVNRVNKAAIFNIGYNMYYKMYKNIHLLAGADFKLRFDVNRRGPVFQATTIAESTNAVNDDVYIDDFAKANLKFGAKLILCEYISIETYITGGAGFIKTSTPDKTQIRLGYNTGVGTDIVFNDRFFVGAEYLWIGSDAEFTIGQKAFKFNAYSLVAKAGFQF